MHAEGRFLVSKDSGRANEQDDAEAEVERFHDQLGTVAVAETTRMPMVFTNAQEPKI